MVMKSFIVILFFLIALLDPVCSQGGVDMTLIAGSNGVAVVDACILKLRGISLFRNDFGFLKRIALVESNFGQNTTATNMNPTGGIWQITSTIYNALNDPGATSILNLVTAATTVLGAPFANMSFNDFNVPIRSALAAKLYIELQLQQNSFPGSITEQANWWAAYYHPGGSSTFFFDIVDVYEQANRCNVSKLDLFFLLDGSGSIGSGNFQTSLSFVHQTAAEFTIAADQVRTGLMIYTYGQIIRSLFNQHQSNLEFSNIVTSTSYYGGGTRTGSAITEVMNSGFSLMNGARPLTEGVPRILIVLTDGESQDDVTGPSQAIKNANVTVFGIGVGSGFDANEVREIASDPDSEYAFEFTQFSSLVSVLKNSIATQACNVPAVVPSNSFVAVVVQPAAVFYGAVTVPFGGSVQLSYEIQQTTSIGIVYVSFTVANPSAALYDLTFQVGFGTTTYFINAPAAPGGLPSLLQGRRKRQAGGGTTTMNIAFVASGSEPISLRLGAQTSSSPAVQMGTPSPEC